MQDLVIVPTFDRPEMLWLCLDHLAASPEVATVDIRVVVDAHVSQPLPPREEIETVLRQFDHLNLSVQFRQPHGYQGNSYNVLTALKDAYATMAPHVFLVEDDVVIQPGFFVWHREVQQVQPLGCSIGVSYGHSPYASLGVCFRREALTRILPHCCHEYFVDMRSYIHRRFELDRRLTHVLEYEQDGLWARVLGTTPVAWASPPMAQHVGWYGYHRRRSLRPTGTLTERYTQVKDVLTDPAKLQLWVRDFGDIHPLHTPCN